MEDLYGIPFPSNGDANNPATFYISLSPNYVYLERFAFKFVIRPFSSSVAGVSASGDMTIGETALTTGGGSGSKVIDGTSTLDDATVGSISPNPHTHSISGSLGGLSYGIKKINTSSLVWRVHIDGIDITDYLIEQHDGNWITGEGVYPTNKLTNTEDFYDILDVASMMTVEGKTAERERLIEGSNFKKVEIFSDAPFGVDAYLYVAYPHTNR